MSKPVYILNGPNLNLLGKREPEIYGSQTLADIEAATAAEAKGLKLSVTFRQNYNSPNLKVSSMKTLVLIKSGNRWLIQQELVGS